MKAALAILCLLCPLSQVPFAQEAEKAEEIFTWFPEGAYGFLQHFDQAAMRKEKAFPTYKESFIDPLDIGIVRVAPESMLEFDSSTRAVISRLKAKKAGGKDSNGVYFDSEFVGDELYVFRYFDLETLLEKALADGRIQDTGEALLGKAVYTYKSRDAGYRDKQFLCYATDSGELLVAGELKSIQAMVQAGMGERACLMDDPFYRRLLEFVPKLGQRWIAFTSVPTTEMGNSAALKYEVPASELRKSEEEAEKGLQWSIDAYIATDVLVYKEIRIYGDEEFGKAQKAGEEKLRADTVQHFGDYVAYIRQKQKESWKDAVYTREVVFDDKLLEITRDMNLKSRERLLKRLESAKVKEEKKPGD